jgi:hypothetical protein
MLQKLADKTEFDSDERRAHGCANQHDRKKYREAVHSRDLPFHGVRPEVFVSPMRAAITVRSTTLFYRIEADLR